MKTLPRVLQEPRARPQDPCWLEPVPTPTVPRVGRRQGEARAHPGTHLQLLGVRGESLHSPNRLCPPKDKGQAGPLARDTGDVHALQGVEMDPPHLDRCHQPGVPAQDRAAISAKEGDSPSRNTRARDRLRRWPGGQGPKRQGAQLPSPPQPPSQLGRPTLTLNHDTQHE